MIRGRCLLLRALSALRTARIARVALISLILAAMVSLAMLQTARASLPPGITATCAFSTKSNPSGFTSSGSLTIEQGQDIVLRIGTFNEDQGAPAIYTANFTAALTGPTFFFGAAHTVYTAAQQGGASLGTGNVQDTMLATSHSPAGTDEVIVNVTSDHTGSTVLASCDINLTILPLQTNPMVDSDGDGIPDVWEVNGYDTTDANGNKVHVDLQALGADPLHKDVFMQLDWLPNQAPTRDELQTVKTAFAQAPADAGGTANPDGKLGINLHIDTGNLIAPGTNQFVGDNLGFGHQLAYTKITHLDDNFYAAKQANFHGEWAPVFHYAIAGDPNDSSLNGKAIGGQAEICGNDLIEFNHDPGSFMHELGHNLCLDHGGNESHNCKPNYISVMNYHYQFGIPVAGAKAVVDYSPALINGARALAPLPTLTENNLSETSVLDPNTAGMQAIFANGQGKLVRSAVNAPIDWNGDGVIEQAPVTANIDTSVNGFPADCTNTTTDGVLTGFNDWANVNLAFRGFGNNANGAVNPSTDPDPTLADMQRMQQQLNTTALGISVAASPDPVAAGGELTYTLTVANLGPNPADGTTVADTLPSGVSYLRDTGGCSLQAPHNVSCPIADELPAGTNRTITVVVGVDPGLVYAHGGPATLLDSAAVSHSAGPDPNGANDTASVSTTVVAAADLAVGVTTTTSPSGLLVGDSGQMTLQTTASNGGPSSPMDAQVATHVGATSGIVVTPSGVRTNVPALAKGAPQSFSSTFTLQCVQGGHQHVAFTTQISPAHVADSDPALGNNSAVTQVDVDCILPVTIDVKPGDDPPTLNPNSQGKIPVAVLSTASFDATTIDPGSVRIGPSGASAVHVSIRDVNGDGLPDLVVDVQTDVTGIAAGDTQACLKGSTVSGVDIFGCDTIRTVPPAGGMRNQ